jgi:hypothetical protein
MLEERERSYKQGLAERLAPRIPAGERVDAVAVCQLGPAPWIQLVPMVVGILLLLVSVLSGSLPAWVGVIGALIVLAGIVAVARVPRRLLARTNRSVHVFALPRSEKATFEAPLASVPAADAPPYKGGAVEIGGERMWPNYGSGLERNALEHVLGAP